MSRGGGVLFPSSIVCLFSVMNCLSRSVCQPLLEAESHKKCRDVDEKKEVGGVEVCFR